MLSNPEIQSIKNRFGIIGNAPALNYALNIALQVAATDLTVLITGESGSGKESFSKIIHNLSSRKHGPFIAINCGAIPEGTIDSELFGHVKGSFTGAIEDRKGYFEITNGGTIFLDEIAEMPIGTQARLLRVLENKEFIRVGSSKVQKTDVRVVAATNVNLIDAVQRGKFREDLYYRLNTVPIAVPPLRERGSDIDMLFRKFTTDFAERYRITPITLTPEARDMLISYNFPGNIRQLKNIAEQIQILEAENKVPIAPTVLVKYLPNYASSTRSMTLLGGAAGGANGPESFNERELLYKILFDMRRDVNDLKKLVLKVLNNEAYGSDILREHDGLFNGIEAESAFTKPHSDTKLLPSHSQHQPTVSSQPTQSTTPNIIQISPYDDVEDIAHETAEDESLSLEQKEKEMIIKALQRSNGKRKYAAQALGISERTLYRKIKQYDIEEE
ncbi:sigma-54 interaction domain-containing protein [Runella aurantiaca]|uniref:Sigma-54-dependent Fis family transcriptional regulator n=1 Tax=Runella aurantiaca TaxID=2282308 RepID=A0A369I3Y2_9BACT|nr:sigma-54 dependent transcriptional regulator [Runella aurantiaca]RDB03197.1 sigma-54-dependent Fis family transcriptional regulator [Runella aurantiaca]